MQVLKTINNNIVSCVDDDGREIIAMGRGLGFRCRPGSVFPPEQAEKVFRMDSQSETDRLKDLLQTLPQEQIEVCAQLISHAAEQLPAPLSKSIYLTLPDHLNFALLRRKKGLEFRNPLLTEVRIFYPREYAEGCFALDLIRQTLHVDFPIDEAANIALHYVNAECDMSLSQTLRITGALHEILEILRRWPGFDLHEGTLACDELTVHLKFLVMQGFTAAQDSFRDTQFTAMIESLFPEEFRCAAAVAAYLETQCGRPVSDESKAYLALHIHRTNHA